LAVGLVQLELVELNIAAVQTFSNEAFKTKFVAHFWETSFIQSDHRI